MKKVTKQQLRKIQLIELQILKEFDKICQKNNLKYILVGGTLIGAIRHNGFIPWDDDIDVSMPRDDYNKFVEIQKKELDKTKYYFQSIETDAEFGLLFGKMRRKNSIYSESTCPLDEKKQGIWIDIFPIDKIDDNRILAFFTFQKIFYYKTIIAFKQNYKFASKGVKKIIQTIIKILSKLYTLESAKKKYFSTIKQTNKKNSNKVINHGGTYLLKEITDKKYYENITTHKFENETFNIPKDYDEYLTQIYGDYMKLPPKEKQVSNHLVEKIKLPK